MNIRDAVAECITGMVDLPRHGDNATDYPRILAKVSVQGEVIN
jgi:hypothetical protein